MSIPAKSSVSQVISLTLQEVTKLKQIERECELSEWTFIDYKNEVKRDDSIILVNRLNDEIIAFLITRFSQSALGGEADLLNFGVSTSFRKKGIGNELFKALVKELSKRNIQTLWLEVRRSNKKAIEFYSKRDFETTQIRKHFYTNPIEDALLLKLELGKLGNFG